jgi:hypothetical protein
MSIDISMRSAQKTNARPGGPPTRPLGSCVPVGDASPSTPARKDMWGDGGPWAYWQPTGPTGESNVCGKTHGKKWKKHDFLRGSPVCKWILKIYGNVYLVLGEKPWCLDIPLNQSLLIFLVTPGTIDSWGLLNGITRNITSYLGLSENGEWTPGPQFMASINVWKNLLHVLGTNEQTVAAKNQWVYWFMKFEEWSCFRLLVW